eukprot:TRINITY_DN13672_c1_g1_i1.p1 TRINITY_DN13672_c1_g1~~TRINITY_DN13672_c1_g1_i1.p1  ORF type:complete len:263 (+),score=33.02 TRINITY_DN13672_c1_g1_i1:42-830(+)
MITLHISCADGSTHAADASGKTTVKELLNFAAACLQANPRDVTLYYEGDEMTDMEATVAVVGLIEGSVLEAVPSKRLTARMDLRDLGVGYTVEELCRVLRSDQVVSSESEKARIAELMVDCDDGADLQDALFAAADLGYCKVVEVLATSIDINSHRVWDKSTCLHIAALSGNEALTSILLTLGASINALDKHKRTPLHCSAFAGHIHIVRFLISKGASIRTVAISRTDLCLGETPLDTAWDRGHTDIAHLLRSAMQCGAMTF